MRADSVLDPTDLPGSTIADVTGEARGGLQRAGHDSSPPPPARPLERGWPVWNDFPGSRIVDAVIRALPDAHRVSLALATTLALALSSPRARAAEKLYAAFDLQGWRKSGAVTVTTPPLEIGGPDALLDNDPRTAVRILEVPAGQILLQFKAAQIVRNVTVITGASTPTRVSLTVIGDGDQRFKAGEFDVQGGDAASFQLLDVPVSRLQVDVTRLEGDAPLSLADIRVEGQLEILNILLEDVPETLPDGGRFPYRVLGQDSVGGRPDLTERAQLVVDPQRALALLPGFRAATRVQGPVTLQAHLGTLHSLMRPLLVTAIAPPPPAPEALPGLAVVTLHLQGEPPFEISRRTTGDKSEATVGRTETNVYHDDTVEPGMAYAYMARRTDRLDNPLTENSAEVRVRTFKRLPAGWADPGRIPILVALFTDSLAAGEQDAAIASLEAARLFIYRHSLGRVVLDPVYLPVSGPTPVTTGPTMLGIEQRLRQLGIRDDQFGVVFAIANDVEGDFAGFHLLGRSIGAMGRGARVPTPRGALGPAPDIAWSFVHELQHVFATLIAESDEPQPLPSGHFAEDFGMFGMLGTARGRPFDGNEAWDGAALLLASFDGIERIGAPWRRPLEVQDSDDDGLPDADPRVPLDELRFGTDPLSPDTDADELPDLAEAAAGLYRGTNPLDPDSDDDGRPDGQDPWPLSNFTGIVSKSHTPRFLASVPTPVDPDKPPVLLSASWNEQALAFEVLTDRPTDAFLDIDGSGAFGRWETDVNTGSADAPASDVWAGPARITLRANTAPIGVFVGDQPLPGAMVASERLPGGSYRLLAVLPRRLGPGAGDVFVPADAPLEPGLRLRAGTLLGLALTVRPSRLNDPAPFDPYPADGSWNSLFDTHHLMDAHLQN